jgi:hypothetical protein
MTAAAAITEADEPPLLAAPAERYPPLRRAAAQVKGAKGAGFSMRRRGRPHRRR